MYGSVFSMYNVCQNHTFYKKMDASREVEIPKLNKLRTLSFHTGKRTYKCREAFVMVHLALG